MAMPAVYPLTALTLSRAAMGRGTLGRVFEFTLMLESPAGVPKVNYGYDLAVLIIQGHWHLKTKQLLMIERFRLCQFASDGKTHCAKEALFDKWR